MGRAGFIVGLEQRLMMQQALSVAVIGGSLAGCAIAQVFARAGHQVDVYERSPTELEGRGAGIVLPIPLQQALIADGFIPPDYASLPLGQRDWIIADGSVSGREAWTQSSAASSHHWGALWQALRQGIADAHYHHGSALVDYDNTPEGVTFRLSNGEARRVDLLVAADGYRSSVREQMPWGSESDYAGYVLWRGNFAVSRASDHPLIARMQQSHSWLSSGYAGGHVVIYLIPGLSSGDGADEQRVNWALYGPPPQGLTLNEPGSVPEGAVTPALMQQLTALREANLPPQIADLIGLTRIEEVSIQPIYDELAVHFHEHRVMLVGDAAAVVRPHTASGATKALQDALAVQTLLRESSSLDNLLRAYGAERLAACNALVELGRRLGHAQVEQTPDWPSMAAADFERWNAAVFAGDSLYMYDDRDHA